MHRGVSQEALRPEVAPLDGTNREGRARARALSPRHAPSPAAHPPPLQPAAFKRYPRPDSLAHLVAGLPPDGVDLLTRLLQHDPAKRISALDAMAHPFFATVPDHIKAGGLMGLASPTEGGGSGSGGIEGAGGTMKDV